MTGIAEMFAELDGRDRYEFALAVLGALGVRETDRDRWARSQAARRDRFASGDSGNTKHGVAAYRCGCRCDLCRDANTTYMREYQRRRAKDPEFQAKRRAYGKARRSKAA